MGAVREGDSVNKPARDASTGAAPISAARTSRRPAGSAAHPTISASFEFSSSVILSLTITFGDA